MNEKNDLKKYRKEINELLDLVRQLVEELGTEIELHYQDHELPELGDTNTVMLLTRASKTLRRHGIQPPSVVANLLFVIMTAGEDG